MKLEAQRFTHQVAMWSLVLPCGSRVGLPRATTNMSGCYKFADVPRIGSRMPF